LLSIAVGVDHFLVSGDSVRLMIDFKAFACIEKGTADLPSREKSPQTQLPLPAPVLISISLSDKRPGKRAIRDESENNSVSCRLSGGGTDIRTLSPLFEKGKYERKFQ